MQLVKLDGAANFRDIGGYITEDGRRIQSGRVFRSDHLGELSPDDWERVLSLNIELVADLRNDAEREFWPCTWPESDNLNYLCLDYELDLNQLSEIGYQMLAYKQIPLMRRFFAILAKGSPPVALVHCTAGQDRTGFVCALLMHMLGVSKQQILEDYVLSFYLRKDVVMDPKRVEQMATFYGMDVDIREFDGPPTQTIEERANHALTRMEEAILKIEEDFDSLDHFIEDELLVDGSMIASIRSNLLV